MNWIRSKADELAYDAGCRFSSKRADHVRQFFYKYLRHSKGEFANKPFELLNWEWEDVIAPIFGWVRPNGTRRFRRTYVEVPKKNGKSTISAGIELYMLCGDNEPGAEVYTAAGDRRQASIIYNEVVSMVRKSPALSKRLHIRDSKKLIYYPETESILEALSADVPTKEGLNIHCLVFDELHTQPNRKLYQALRYGGASRRQPLMFMITTAGDDQTSLCYEVHTYAKKIIDNEIRDDEFYGYIRTIAENDDPFVEESWYKANPSLGVTIPIDDMISSATEAQNNVVLTNDFLRYRLNRWVSSSVRWLSIDKWNQCQHGEVDPPQKDEKCYLALDLSSNIDLTSLALWFPERKILLVEFWSPEETMQKRERERRTRYDYWAKQGLIHTIPGAVIDNSYVHARINELNDIFDIVNISMDPWGARDFALKLRDEGFIVQYVRQGFGHLSDPMKAMEKMVLNGELTHYGNPVLAWQAGNVVREIDSNNNIRPNKKKSLEAIDGIVASIMAIGAAMIDEEDKPSVYETRGPLIIDNEGEVQKKQAVSELSDEIYDDGWD